MKKISLVLSLAFLMFIVVSSSSQAQERKKWSPQAKGAVIGAATGGAAGAIIHKRNRVVGGVVGGVVGAGAGYGVGKIIDNKRKKEEAAEAAERIAAIERSNQYKVAAARSAAPAQARTTKKAVTPAAPEPAAPAYAANDNVLFTSGYVLNPHYGDPSKPYYTSEYRVKSW
ncbi:glycine zipper domain-containing protein [Pontibacter sp. H249]|uniref:glycine zipper domain-containing protein n=1 Tax=Pontibacter sp. H249 TaxID=3133420 RepID=UPI0030BBBCC6